MKVLVKDYISFGTTYHDCVILPPHSQAGNRIKLDLTINQQLTSEPEQLIGKIVEVGWVVPYISIGMDCKIVEQNGTPTPNTP